MLTCPWNVYPLTPHFYIVKVGFTGVYIIVLFFALKDRLWVLVRTASLRRLKRVPIIYALSKNMKIIKKNQLKIVIYTAVKNCSVLHGRVFVMAIMGPRNKEFNVESLSNSDPAPLRSKSIETVVQKN